MPSSYCTCLVSLCSMHTYRLAVGSWRYRQLPTENRRSSVGVYRTPTRLSGLIGAIPPIQNLNRRKSQSALVGRCVPNVNPIVGTNRQVCMNLGSTRLSAKIDQSQLPFQSAPRFGSNICLNWHRLFHAFSSFLLRCFHPTSFKTSVHIISDAKTTFSYIHYCILWQYANIYTDNSTIPLPGFE